MIAVSNSVTIAPLQRFISFSLAFLDVFFETL